MKPARFGDLWSTDRAAQNAAYAAILPLAEADMDEAPYFAMVLVPGEGRRL